MAPVAARAGSAVKLEACRSDDDWVFEKMFVRGFGERHADPAEGVRRARR